MITRSIQITILVKALDEAKEFYTKKPFREAKVSVLQICTETSLTFTSPKNAF